MTITDLTYKSIEMQDWEGMERFLSRMNVLDFRKIQTSLRKNYLCKLDNDLFWETYYHLIKHKKQAFLACIIAIEHLAKEKKIDFNNDYVKQISLYLQREHPDAVKSLLNMSVPLMVTEEQIEGLFNAFDIDVRERIAILLKTDTPLTYFVLFKNLKLLQDNKVLMKKCCLFINNKNTDLAKNMACIVKEYFGIHEATGVKSLNIEQYELNYIDRDRDTFINVLQGKRPKL